jgi:hypothetical protein
MFAYPMCRLGTPFAGPNSMTVLFIVSIVATIAAFMYAVQQDEKNAAATFQAFIDDLQQRPLDSSVHNEFRCVITKLTNLSHSLSESAYHTALEIIATHPDSLAARTFALDVGRWHHGRIRPDRKLTIYDEQAMQNDILVRSQSAPN